ncbi:DUF4349 domain-containing protein [Cellulomonas sp. PhB143]|uniref:DUF4349 domain-containing protein n=1 Tax=Cellulomonas sp. PhB143 TaxID=2485186 RepID=UPI000FB513AF|nr:DUF4349 domain-containing protein [Cellulomonas sp. PhB143]ROS76997.1 uncharacterized protein DUF4349 [Cellulomonas sp. PhB143]
MRALPRRAGAALVGTLLAAALVTGCSSSDSSDTSASSVADAGAGARAGSAADEAADEDGSAAQDRSIVTTGYVTVLADDPVGASDRVSQMVETAGGRVEARTRYEPAPGEDAAASADLTVRVPADAVTGTVEALGKLGDVRDVSIDSTDVTSDVQDLDARILALSTSTQRLEELMAKAATTSDLLAAEKQLTSRQGDLESLEGQRKALGDQVAMSTLSISITEPDAQPELSPGGFLGGLSTGWDALLSFLNAAVVVVGVLLPWIVAVAVVAAVVLAVRRRRRRGAEGTSGSAGGRGGPEDDDHGPAGPSGSATDTELVGAGR